MDRIDTLEKGYREKMIKNAWALGLQYIKYVVDTFVIAKGKEANQGEIKALRGYYAELDHLDCRFAHEVIINVDPLGKKVPFTWPLLAFSPIPEHGIPWLSLEVALQWSDTREGNGYSMSGASSSSSSSSAHI